jgi:O-antigen ligase
MDDKIAIKVKFINFIKNLPLILIAVTLPWSILTNNLAIILLIIIQIYRLSTNLFFPKLDVILFFFWSLFFLSGIGLTYTTDFPNGLKEFEKHLVFFIFPIFLPSLSQKSINNLIYYFCISFSLNFFHFLFLSDFNFSVLGNYQNLPMHYPYFGIYSAFCGLFILYRIAFNYNHQKFYLLPIFLFFFWLVLISSSRNAQIYFFTTCYIIILSTLKSKKSKLLAIPIIIGFSILLILKLPRFDQFVDALNVKELSWLCSIESLDSSNKWLWGVGTGSAQNSLQECYKLHNSWFRQFKYNSHNQYLTFLLTNGIFSFLIFSFLILYYMIISFKNKDFLLFLLIFSLSLSSISESVLLVNKGIIFYTFWLCLFSRVKV